jgi:membrane-associated phospholipid phosphatase
VILKHTLLRTAMLIGIPWAYGNLTLVGMAGAFPPPQELGAPSPPKKPATPKAQGKDADAGLHAESDSDQDTTFGAHQGFKALGKDFLEDQKRIWTSPARLRFSDADWLVPASGFAAGLFVTDRDVSTHLSNNPSTISHYNSLSTAGIGALVGGAAGLWVLSYPAHNEHWRETGFLAGEAAINSLVAVEALKYSLRRDRPFQGDGSGPFFQGGTSFPSEHAAAAWSVAGVIAHEYPGVFPRIVAYGLASLVSYSRIKGRQHFPSDVFIGGMMGQFIAQDVYTRRHDPELGGSEWRSIGAIVRGDGYLSPANQGSPYVPLDSWIYPAVERLMAMGSIDSAFSSLRPWTRRECARLIGEADDRVNDVDASPEAARINSVLQAEFADELEANGRNARARMESVYVRASGISGDPLGAGTHFDFGQTVINDYGRPYESGVNAIAGFSGWAISGRWVGYVRAEYQHAPSAPPLTLGARETIAKADALPATQPATPVGTVNRLELLDAYVGLNLENWQVTFGQQSLWWGPTEGGPMLISNNAEPIPMFRVNRVSPFQLPSILHWLGPIRIELFLGQLSGQSFLQGPNGISGSFDQNYAPQPFIHGQKIAFKPTPNFEFSLSRSTVMGGPGVPLTFGRLGKSLFTVAGGASNGLPGSANDPGDRRSGLDWQYRLPKLRNWVTFYGDAFSDDQISPIAYLDRSAISAGLYFSHIPKLPKLDLRFEGVYSDVPAGGAIGGGFFYWNTRFLNGYTNNGNLIGSWIGRDGQGAQGWANYWFTPKNRLQLSYRHQKVSQDPRFIPGGGTITDVGVGADVWTTSSLGFSGKVQYEAWTFPAIVPGQQRNLSVSLQLQFNSTGWSFRGSNP